MGTLSLKAAIKVKRYRSYRGEVGQTAPNVLQRDFKATRPNEKWVTDVTEFAVNGRKLYLSPVIDLFNNEVISYSLSERPVMNMVENMLDQAFKKLNPHEHPVLHSDQGWQYRMRRYQNILKEHGIKQSMSRKGNCLDNAVVECFFGTLKSECYPLDELLRAAEIPRSTFYYHLKALSKPDKYADVKKRIGEIYHENRGRYGYRRVTLSLHREGKQINHKAVQRLMGTLSLKAAIKVKRYRSYRGEVGQTAPNVLQRDFKATRPNEKWVTDVTEFAVNGRKLYLSPVIDLFNNEVISYSLSERPVMNMVENMLDQAFKKLNPHEHPVLHSDQGWQYRMRRYQNILKEHGIKQSMSRKGNCLDNAVVECFFGTLKSECFYLDEWICPYISRHLLSLNPLQARCRRYSRGER
ncbi:IS150 ORF2 [Shigella flexneri]|nr:IS150 ORF2 [Shigella flexneri]